MEGPSQDAQGMPYERTFILLLFVPFANAKVSSKSPLTASSASPQTVELTRLQVGTTGPVNLIVSTILEAENILPLLLEYKDGGRPVNVRALPSPPISSPSNLT